MSEAIHQELSRRNAWAVMDTLGRQDVKIQEQQQRIDALSNAVAALTEQVTMLNQMLCVQRVKMMGHGPTAV